MRGYAAVLRAEMVPDSAPERVLHRLGFRTEDVRLIVLSHFHADHVATLCRFPKARVLARRDVFERIRACSPARNLRHGIFTELLPPDLAGRLIDVQARPVVHAGPPLDEGRDLLGDGSLLAIDLPGHADGHFGLCFPKLPTPLLYAVDAQWLLRAAFEQRVPGFPASLVAEKPGQLAHSARLLTAFRDAGGHVMLCHDPDPAPFDLREPSA
ncbi:metallo-beta-lactamase superfamily protein [Nitratireductor pacificus pht-3B]|uniref:Metallo-beta-lactamase superfamily protein n=1 Tax=Nitratireductor pacificus pht-3B TaxID=391937 RepID=K2ME78_9HYPH|nr:metallo-beta-lactamase superfamily protein [Nitratireductor pacificus pht-3B]